ncbi:helix-turn-helix transcriptional regulator [Heyndrickxia oleronia]|uniref:helix-turn-helix transcriptional regulator n=1 Tax=Heyndrickxia oleronia TaxID=38875 RepID=UPI001B299954|nr:hypothetical protein [Heyndrickxia oleronia]GIN39612.1 hypothetical protein J19TS1_25610 [Heyndrickxia oleronia]
MNPIKSKAMRYFLGESQAEFSRRLGVSTSTVCDIEKGKRGISDYIRAKLIRIEADLPADDFFIFYEKFKLGT